MTDLLYFNGVNASTGEYLTPPLSAEDLAQRAGGETVAPEHLLELKWRKGKAKAHYGVKEGVDPNDLGQAGWGVIFAPGVDPAVQDALRELLNFRKTQANRLKERYHEYTYQAGESKNVFLARQRAGPGAVDPDKVPYYLLIVGDPEKIPYAFQYQLDVAYAVGRIHFDTVEDYARYAQSVVRAEQEDFEVAKRAAFFGVANPDDPNTRASADNLVKPLADTVGALGNGWDVQTYMAEEANKARLEGLLNAQAPAFLFTASHGAGFDMGDPRQMKHQGALICQDWGGPVAMGGRAVPQTMYYAQDDVTDDARLHGMITFHFACFGAGTPRYDEFSHLKTGLRERNEIAPQAFLARLPKKLLAHPKGGALAVVGHVDRAWGSSFLWNKDVAQLSTFESALTRLLNGSPVGAAMEFFNARYAELATTLSAELEDLKFNRKVDPMELATTWTANNDARGYTVIGDPAVRLRVNGKPKIAPLERATLTLSAEPTPPAAAEPPPPAAASTPRAALDTARLDATGLDATLEKLQGQVEALAETIKELRTVLQQHQQSKGE